MKTSRHTDAFPALFKTSSWYKDPAFIAAAAAPFAGMAADAAASGIKNLIAAKQKTHAFKSMLAENPHLKGRDAKSTQRYFNTLWTTNPQMAKDPTVAGAFVHQQHGSGDENFPHRGIMAGAADMAKMRSDMSHGRPAPSQVGRRVEGTIRDVMAAGMQAKDRDFANRERMFDEAMGRQISKLEQREHALRQREAEGRGLSHHGSGAGPKSKQSSPSSLRALLSI